MARTPKARALGSALRQAREGRGLLLRELAVAINRDTGVLSRWETGDRTPRPEHVAQILTRLDVHGDRYADIMTLAYGTDEPQWVATTLPDRRQQMVAYMDWEQNASRIVEVAPLLIPGLLQTRAYIEAMMTDGGLPPDTITSRVDARIERKQIITQGNPADLLVLLGQAALNQDIGGRHVAIAQLQHLLDMATRRNIELRIVPDRCGWHPGLEEAFALIESTRSTAAKRAPTGKASIVFVGTRRTVLMLHEDSDVAAYRSAIDEVAMKSLPQDASVNVIGNLRDRLEKNRET